MKHKHERSCAKDLQLREMFADFARRLLTREHTESENMRQACGIVDNGESYDDVLPSKTIENH